PDPPSRSPRFEELIPNCGDLLPSPAGIATISAEPDGKESRQFGMRARAERALLDALSLFAVFRATVDELDRVRLLERTRAAGEEQGEQAADQAGDGKATPP